MPTMALAAEAVREVSHVPVPRFGAPREVSGVAWPSVTVQKSEVFGDGALAWSAEDEGRLFSVDHAWEVELSLVISDDGRPSEVFLEKRSGFPEVDRGLLASLARRELWVGVQVGRGTMVISYSPKKAESGALNED